MSTSILTASVAEVPIGHIKIEGLLASDGAFYIAIPQAADISKTSRNTASRDFKRLMGKDFKTSKLRTQFNRNITVGLSLPEFERLIARLDRAGNTSAQNFRDCLVGLSLQQLFCDAFEIEFNENDRQEWLCLRQESKSLFWALTEQIQSWISSRNCSQPDWVYYSTAFDCLNLQLFGLKSKQIREEIGIKCGLNRDHFGSEALRHITQVQESSARLMAASPGLKATDAIKTIVSANLIQQQSYKK